MLTGHCSIFTSCPVSALRSCFGGEGVAGLPQASLGQCAVVGFQVLWHLPKGFCIFTEPAELQAGFLGGRSGSLEQNMIQG